MYAILIDQREREREKAREREERRGFSFTVDEGDREHPLLL